MHRYVFQTNWQLPASRDRCWQELVVQGSWEHWWPALRKESWPNPPVAEGSDFWLRVRSPLGYRLRVHLVVREVSAGHSLRVSGGGDLSGSGDATFFELPGLSQQNTELRINWSVQTTKPWMNFLAPLAAPGFRWAHDALMRDGERRFRKWLLDHPQPGVRP